MWFDEECNLHWNFRNRERVTFFSRGCLEMLLNELKVFIFKIFYSTKDTEIPKNLLEDVHTASQQLECGIVYDKKPFKIRLEPNKKYNWCLCGQSRNQPFCDGTHKSPYLQIKLKPVRFQVETEKDYWLCNCKQTSHRPFCDGTHKRGDIQAKIK